ncbi:MAG: methyltransferase domain-containing protein, partial [Solirubrobacteraceae bacterium]
ARMAPATDLRAAIASNPVWYHSIELAPGLVTPGHIDLRPAARRVLPERMEGRALDVGTFDGFWAFELERRGAQVVAIDVETVDQAQWPPIHRERLEAAARNMEIQLGRGFAIAREALGSRVERVICPVGELTCEAIGGPVRHAFLGALLLHLRDPVGALERVLHALEPGGRLLLLEPVDPRTTLLHPRRPVAQFRALATDFTWWKANLATLRAWLRTAGFAPEGRPLLLLPRGHAGMDRVPTVALTARRPVSSI